MRARKLIFVALVTALVWIGCTKPRRVVLTKDQQERIAAHILEQAPAELSPRIDADFDGRIRLLGVEVPDEPVAPGDSFNITYYWESVKPPAGEWKIFVHLEHPGPPEQRRQILDHHAVGELYPINEWQEGQIIKDVQTVSLDSNFPPGNANLWLGIFNEVAWREQGRNDRLRLVNTDDVPNDGDNRVRAARITVRDEEDDDEEAKPSARDRRTYDVMKLTTGLDIDGALDETAWIRTRQTRPFVRPDGLRASPHIQTRARMLWDDEYLYVGVHTLDDDIWNPHTERNAPLWEHDVVEIFIDPGADQKDYVEIQVSPSNVLFDAWFDEHRRPSWEEAAERFNIGIKSAVTADGSVNERDDDVTDRSWTVELAIPFAELPNRDGPPEEGETWALNIYRLDSRGADQIENQAVWAPVGSDFHALENAGRITFRGSRPAPAALRSPPTVAPSEEQGDHPESEDDPGE